MFQQREPFFWVLVIGFVVLLARAVEAQEDWIALVLGTTLVPVVTELTCYYYSVFVLFALLWRKWPSSGAALSALSASTLLMPVIFPNSDDAFTASSALIVLFVATVIGAMLLRINASKTTLSRITTGNAKPVLQKHA